MDKMIRIKDARGEIVWINRSQIVGVIEERTNPGSVIVMREGLKIHMSCDPDTAMMKFIGT